MSNYPPGVTGNEYAIAGPDWDGEIALPATDYECEECGWIGGEEYYYTYVLSPRAYPFYQIACKQSDFTVPLSGVTFTKASLLLEKLNAKKITVSRQTYRNQYHDVWWCPSCNKEHSTGWLFMPTKEDSYDV